MGTDTCQYEGCNKAGMACFLPDETFGTSPLYYCDEHAQSEGFCFGCGGFWAGIGAFEVSYSGLCEDCKGDEDDIGSSEYFDDDDF